MTRRSLPLTCALALFGLLAACAPEDVVVADVPPGADEPGRHREPCITDQDCHHPNAFCRREACDDIAGHCEIRPLFCDQDLAPACGCDGVTYWNDCLRKLAGVTASTLGACETGNRTCGGSTSQACPAGASCARLYPSDRCEPSNAGVCWMLPPTCPPVDTGPRWSACASAGLSCVDMCSAIRSETASVAAPPGTCR